MNEKCIKVLPIVGGYLLILPEESPRLHRRPRHPSEDDDENLTPFGGPGDMLAPLQNLIFCASLADVATKLIELENEIAGVSANPQTAATSKRNTPVNKTKYPHARRPRNPLLSFQTLRIPVGDSRGLCTRCAPGWGRNVVHGKGFTCPDVGSYDPRRATDQYVRTRRTGTVRKTIYQ